MKVDDIILNKYRIVRIVSGDGTNKRGMSNLYKAQDRDLGIHWAIKEIIKNSDGTVSIQQSALIREAQIMRKLQHPSIPRIVSIEQLPDRILIVMDWVDGKSVGDWLRTSGAMTPARGVSIIKSVCGVLSYLHNRPTPIFYRDMKPENIMYDPNTKRVMLLDFGISVEVDPNKPIKDRLGTKGYFDKYSLAPSRRELASGVKERYFDLRSDVYSLGWTMFHIFTGVHPHNYITRKSKKVEEVILPLIESRFEELDENDKPKFRYELSKLLRTPLEGLVTGEDIGIFVPKVIRAIENAANLFIQEGDTANRFITGLDKELSKVIPTLRGSYVVTRDVREYSKNIPQSLADVIIKATEEEPRDRYQSIEELQIALEELDKVDRGLNKKLKRKINTVIGIGFTGMLLSVGSIAPYMAYEQGLKNEYNVLVSNASKSGDFGDFVKVIEYSSKDITPYFGLIDAIKKDGVFSPEEEKTFLDLVNPNLVSLEKDSRYKEFAFEVGRLYWLYYNKENSEETASRWFKDAKGYSKLADVYASVGSFPTEVIKAANEGTDSGMYKKQWDLLNSVTGQSELVELQIVKARLYLLSTYPYRLKADGVSYEEVLASLDSISSLVEESKGKQGRQAELAHEISSKLEEARKVIEEAYSV